MGNVVVNGSLALSSSPYETTVKVASSRLYCFNETHALAKPAGTQLLGLFAHALLQVAATF